LNGTPALLGSTSLDGGVVAFGYRVKETDKHFVVRTQVGMATAGCIVVSHEELEDPVPLPGVEPIAGSAFTGTLRWRKPNAFGGIPSRPVEGEYDFLRGEPTVDREETLRRDNSLIDAQIERDRLEAKRLAEERKRAVQDGMASIQNASR
jgi:hypothetical protein